MTFDFNHHLDYHIKELVEAVSDNKPLVQKLYNRPADLQPEDLIVLLERLQSMEVNITLLNNAYEVHLEDVKKSKRRRKLFKK